MSLKTVGVLQSFTAPTKLDVLFFDRLVKLEQHEHHLMQQLANEQDIAEFEYLTSVGFIEQTSMQLTDLLNESGQKGIESAVFAKRYANLEAWAASGPKWTGDRIPHMDAPIASYYASLVQERLRFVESGMKARLFSLLRSSSSETYTPILREDDESLNVPHASALVQVVVHAFPVPADDVAYEELFEFKNSVAVKRDYELFKRWLREKVRDEALEPDKLREELADLLSDHREHMRLARLKARDDRLYTLFTAPIATIERIVKVQFSKLLDPIYELRKCRMQLLEAEAKSPGKEVAYLHRAAETLGKR